MIYLKQLAYRYTDVFDEVWHGRHSCYGAQEPAIAQTTLDDVTRLKAIDNELRIIENLGQP